MPHCEIPMLGLVPVVFALGLAEGFVAGLPVEFLAETAPHTSPPTGQLAPGVSTLPEGSGVFSEYSNS